MDMDSPTRIDVSLSLELTPTFKPTSSFATPTDELEVHSLDSGPLTLEGCIANRLALCEEFRVRYERGDPSAIERLIEINPEFLNERWVQAVLADSEQGAALLRRRRGRPWGRTFDSEARRLMLVRHVDALCAGTGRSINATLHALADSGILGVGYHHLHDTYYEVRRHGNRAALLFVNDATSPK